MKFINKNFRKKLININIFESIINGLQEAVNYEDGKLTARTMQISVAPLPEITAEEIKDVRKQFRMTQSVFAAVLGVSVKTVEAWESETNHPSGSAKRIISIIQTDPDFIEKYHLLNYS